MKKIILISIFLLSTFCFLLSTQSALAATPVPQNPLPSDDLTKQIEQKVASTVAKLNLVEKRGFVGTVTDRSDRQITISDLLGNTRFIDVDEFTKFSSPDSTSSFGISDIEKGNIIGVLGLYNKSSRRMLGRFVNVMDLPKYLSGVVADKDEEAFTVVVATPNGNSKVSIESVTKIYDAGVDGKLTKSGFTKISISENIIVSGFPDPKDKSTLTAGRVILFPGLPQNPAIKIDTSPSSEPSSTITPSTGSGLILTPTAK